MKTLLRGISGLARRLRNRRNSARKPVISIDDPDLRVVITAFDPAEAASSALERGLRWQPRQPAVLRHHLLLPASRIESARELLEPDQWRVRTEEATPEQGKRQAEGVEVSASRIQHLDALHCSQESSRMAGLAQRLGGTALGWDALQPGESAEDGGDDERCAHRA